MPVSLKKKFPEFKKIGFVINIENMGSLVHGLSIMLWLYINIDAGTGQRSGFVTEYERGNV
jgi:hypothetical protein